MPIRIWPKKFNHILKLNEKNPNFKGKTSFKNWCNNCRRYGHSIAECRQKQQDKSNRPLKHKEPNKSFCQYMKKNQKFTKRKHSSNNSSGTQLISTYGNSTQQFHILITLLDDHQITEIHSISHKIDTVDQIGTKTKQVFQIKL